VDDSGTTNTWQLEAVPGTPASIPAVPAAPTNSIILAQVAVGAGVTTIGNASITDVRTWEVALGGILPVNALTAVPAGYTGHYVHDRSSGRLAHNLASGPAQPKLLPAAPVFATVTAQTNEGGTTEVTLITAAITADGNSDWEIYFKCGAVNATSSSTLFKVIFRVYVDAVQIDQIYSGYAIADTNSYSGVTLTSFAAAALGNRPTAGAHTIKVTFQTGATFGVAVVAAATDPVILRVKPVCL
jgi:hypothetical protein